MSFKENNKLFLPAECGVVKNRAIAKKRKKDKEEELEELEEYCGYYFSFVAGYTSGGIPYGTIWNGDDEDEDEF